MLSIEVPGLGMLELEYLVLDLNGTVALDGQLLPGVAEAVRFLAPALTPILLTADMHGLAEDIGAELECDVRVLGAGKEAEGKLDVVDELGADRVVAIGNGANDALMLSDAALGIAVIGGEGAAATAVAAADVVVSDVSDALGLLREPRRLIATLRR